MTALAPHLEKFFREHLPRERGCSNHTCEAYAYTFRLLLSFAASRYDTTPSSPYKTLGSCQYPLHLKQCDRAR